MTRDWTDPSPTWPEVRDRFEEENKGKAADQLAAEGKTLSQEGTATTASLRREIEEDYDAESPARKRALAQLDGLEKRGIHRIQRLEAQEPHVAIGDHVTREVHRERADEKQAGYDEARRTRDAQDGRRVVEGGDLDKGRHREPEPSTAEWAKAYEIGKDRDASIVYSRDGKERIRDDGRTVKVAEDAKSIKDAVMLCKEQGVQKLDVQSTDPAKRQAIMREAIKQRVQIETHRDPKVEDEYRKALVAVQREIAVVKREAERQHPAERGPTPKDRDTPEIGD